MDNLHTLWWAGLLALLSPSAALADAAVTVREQCAACHAMQAPDHAASSIAERSERKAPPLYYAGNKFQAQWLERWLQAPARIRPAGVFPSAHVKRSEQGDVIDDSSLIDHPALSGEQAAAVAQLLMQFWPFDDRLPAQADPPDIALRMAQLNFTKFKGCDACHRYAPDAGGRSGPELYTAWDRLQPAFISSYIADPVAWDAYTLMPRAGLNDAEVQKLLSYLRQLQENRR